MPPRPMFGRTWVIVDHDTAAAPPFNGGLRATARFIHARLLLIPNCFDQLHMPGAGGVMEVAANASNAKIADIDDTHGHSGTNAPRGVTVITAEVCDPLHVLLMAAQASVARVSHSTGAAQIVTQIS